MESGDWRNQLQPDSRLRIVDKILETLMRHSPYSGQGQLLELKKIAVRFEEKIYTVAESWTDYLRKISLKMLTLETTIAAGNSKNPQIQNQVQQQPIPTVSNQFHLVIGGDAMADLDIDGGDWRTQLQPDTRHRIVNRILETLMRHSPFSGNERQLQELEEIAIRFEEKIYNVAASWADYLRKISLKMLTMETTIAAGNSQNPQIQNQVQQQPIPMVSNQSQLVIGSDWRSQIRPDFRQRIVNKIMETLKRHISLSGQAELLHELEEISVRFEEKIYTVAETQNDYLRKISLKMLTLGPQIQNRVQRLPIPAVSDQSQVIGGDWRTQLRPR
ncbi:hypothetical protein DH2020_005441 [Rehmannia glutinosa]|uniref:Mediator complex subunit 15 KIX domain-containing protein n=1 Tax=Rehmannia glutinosa TaxID=99300 RepID=A0ABR0XG32_REHGL